MTPIQRRAAGAALMWLAKYKPQFSEEDVRQATELYLAGHQAALEEDDLANSGREDRRGS